MDYLGILQERGFIADCTNSNGLRELLKKDPPISAYIGFDCTAPSLHVGSLLQIMALYWLQQCGHRPIVLMGGGTTKVGDPSGKDTSRQLLDNAAIIHNMAGIKTVFQRFLAFGDGPTEAVMVNNADWLDNLKYIDFLRDVGRHFSVNRMLSMESVKLRLDRESHLSFLEFNYMILQAYDFAELYTRENCRLQIGGSDQWGNIINGMELARRLELPELYGLTTPLITTSSGTKMGKTADGAVWLNPDMCSAYDYWQFWRNTEDADVGRFLRLFTTLPLNEITELETLEGAEINQAKIVLANEATALCHGKKAALSAQKTAETTFSGGTGNDLPVIEIPHSEFASGAPAFKLFHLAGLEKSGGAARRLVEGGGARLNDEKITDVDQLITLDDLNADGQLKLSAGKKRHAIIKII